MVPVVESEIAPRTSLLDRVPTWLLAGTAAVAWAVSLSHAHLDSRFSLDLRVYRAAAKSLLGGHNPYHVHFTLYRLPFTYPPAALLAVSPFALGSAHLVEALWWVVNALGVTFLLYLAITAALDLPKSQAVWLSIVFAPIASFVFEPLRANTAYGQINVVLLLLVV